MQRKPLMIDTIKLRASKKAELIMDLHKIGIRPTVGDIKKIVELLSIDEQKELLRIVWGLP